MVLECTEKTPELLGADNMLPRLHQESVYKERMVRAEQTTFLPILSPIRQDRFQGAVVRLFPRTSVRKTKNPN